MTQIAPIIENILEKNVQWEKWTVLYLILLFLIRVKDYDLKVSDAMELMDGRVKFVIRGLAGLLRQKGYEPEVYANVLHIFNGLVEPAALYANSEKDDMNHRAFSEHVDLVRELSLDLQLDLFQVMIDHLDSPHDQKGDFITAHVSLRHSNMRAFISFTLKLGLYGSPSTDSVFRKQFLVRDAEDEANSRGLAKLLMRYFESCLLEISNQKTQETGGEDKKGDLIPNADALLGLKLVLRVLIYISFRQPSNLVLPLRYLNTTSAHFFMLFPKSLSSQPLNVSAQLLSLVCQFNVNINSLVGEGELRAHRLRVPPECKPSVLKSIMNVCFEACTLELMEALREWMEAPSVNMVSRDFTTYHSIMRLIDDNIIALEKEQNKANQSFNYEEMEAILSNGLDTLEKEQQEILDLKSQLAELRSQSTTPRPRPNSPVSSVTAQSLTSLGDLPSLSQQTSITTQLKGLEKMEIKELLTEQKVREQRQKTENALIKTGNVPSEFLCEINSHLMISPMRTPYGNVYEKETIELWLENNGSVDPLNGKVLKKTDLQLDGKLSERIKEWMFEQTCDSGSNDLYEF